MAIDNSDLDPNTPGTHLFIIQVVFLALAWLASSIRAFVKLMLLREFTVDDCLMLLALLGYTATGYFVINATSHGGLGRPPSELSPEKIEIQLRSLYGNIVVSGLVSGLVRVAIALFLLRIAIKRWHRIVLHGIIINTTAMTIVCFFLAVFQCSPPSYFWRHAREGAIGSCHLTTVVNITAMVWSSFAAAMDWILGLLPVSILWNVRINWKSKVSIASVLTFATIAGIALIVRLVYLSHDATTHADTVEGTLAISITAIVELSLGIMAGCIVSLPLLFKKLQSGHKRWKSISELVPWQHPIVQRRRPPSTDEIIMRSPLHPQEPQDIVLDRDVESRCSRPCSSSTRRVLSISNWEIEVSSAMDEEAAQVSSSAKDIEIRTFIQVTSQPSEAYSPVSATAFEDKPLPMLPPPPKLKDRALVRPRPHPPDLYNIYS